MLLIAANYWLDRYSILMGSNDRFDGASYSDVHAVIPSKEILTGVAVLVVRRFPLLEARARFAIRELTKSVRAMAAQPAKAALSLFGAFVITAGLILALWASVHAFGGELSLGLAAFILLVGSTAGNAVPVPGGIGTLEELIEVYTWSQLGIHDKACGVLNVRGYYDHLAAFLDHAVTQGFLRPQHRAINALERLSLGEFERPALTIAVVFKVGLGGAEHPETPVRIPQ
jgi:hypothetical protein